MPQRMTSSTTWPLAGVGDGSSMTSSSPLRHPTALTPATYSPDPPVECYDKHVKRRSEGARRRTQLVGQQRHERLELDVDGGRLNVRPVERAGRQSFLRLDELGDARVDRLRRD